MTPSSDGASAWLSVPAVDELSGEVAEAMRPISEKLGFLPNVTLVLGLTPAHFIAWWRYFDELMRGPSGLTKTQREMIAVVVSAETHCVYCTQAHAAALRLRTKDAVLVDHLLANYRLASIEPRDRAMLDFAVKLTHTPAECGEPDVEALRQRGYGDEEILHIIELTAMFNYTARLATATGMIPNREYHELGRT